MKDDRHDSGWISVDDGLPERPGCQWNGKRWMLLLYTRRYESDWRCIELETEMGAYNKLCHPHESDRKDRPVAWRVIEPPLSSFRE